jgi:hypothetical protein
MAGGTRLGSSVRVEEDRHDQERHETSDQESRPSRRKVEKQLGAARALDVERAEKLKEFWKDWSFLVTFT